MCEMRERLQSPSWSDVEVVDEALGRFATSTLGRSGFQRMVAEESICLTFWDNGFDSYWTGPTRGPISLGLDTSLA